VLLGRRERHLAALVDHDRDAASEDESARERRERACDTRRGDPLGHGHFTSLSDSLHLSSDRHVRFRFLVRLVNVGGFEEGKIMRTFMRVFGATLALVLAVGGVAMAGGARLQTRDQLKDGSCTVAADQLRIRDRDQLKDGSCTVAAARLRTRDRDRLKDGSCQVAAMRLRTRDRDRLKDGSCKAAASRLRTRDRDRLKDGSCKAA